VIDQFAAPFREGGAGGDGKQQQKQQEGSGASKPPEGPVPEMSEGEETSFEALCGSKGGLCAIGFVDASPANANKDAQLKLLEEVRATRHPEP
jgi:hypothetical protein